MNDKEPSAKRSTGYEEIRDPSSGGTASNSKSTSGAPKLFHTLTACTRCRSVRPILLNSSLYHSVANTLKRKTRCDAGLPKCGPCERSGAHCEFFDATKQKTLPRSYVVHLQAKVRELEAELARAEALSSDAAEPDVGELVRGVGMVRFEDEKGEPRFVGTSSGITMTRLVLDFARKHLEKESVKEIKDHRNEFRRGERIKTASTVAQPQVGPGLPTVAPELPTREVTDKLVDIYCQRGEFSV